MPLDWNTTHKLKSINKNFKIQVIFCFQNCSNYPHLRKREDELGFSNWMTPSKGMFSWPTKTGWSLSKEGGGGGGGELEKACLVAAEVESMPPSAFASVILRDFKAFALEANLGLRLEKRGGFGFVNLGGDEREQRLADKAPLGAWPSTSIFALSVLLFLQLPRLFRFNNTTSFSAAQVDETPSFSSSCLVWFGPWRYFINFLVYICCTGTPSFVIQSITFLKISDSLNYRSRGCFGICTIFKFYFPTQSHPYI